MDIDVNVYEKDLETAVIQVWSNDPTIKLLVNDEEYVLDFNPVKIKFGGITNYTEVVVPLNTKMMIKVIKNNDVLLEKEYISTTININKIEFTKHAGKNLHIAIKPEVEYPTYYQMPLRIKALVKIGEHETNVVEFVRLFATQKWSYIIINAFKKYRGQTVEVTTANGITARYTIE